MSILSDYLRDLRTVRATGANTAETSFYPALDQLLKACGHDLKPRVTCVLPLSNIGAGLPDGGFFPVGNRQRDQQPTPGQAPERGVLEAKPFSTNLDQLAASAQVLKYLQGYNQVLITNFRQFRLLVLENGAPRTVEHYYLAESEAAFWSLTAAEVKEHETLFPDFLKRVLLRPAPLTSPKDLAWFLASYAREARARAEDHSIGSFSTLKSALEESLGLHFEGEKGDHFFRSTLVQTLFYGIFSAWVLWSRDHSPAGQEKFQWRQAAWSLHVPVLVKLFTEVSNPASLNASQLTEILDLAGDTLDRVERTAFFAIFSQQEAVAYFYEPFLEAFDPQLRKDLGVWYTPKEIVRYMVERVDHLLRTELAQPLGLASPNVHVLDPCCGTGAYLTAVLDRIHRTLIEQAGDDNALVPNQLRQAALTRVFGFEIMPAPFVIAHLQIAALLRSQGAPLDDETQRAQVFLTNALTGWVPAQDPKTSIFPELQQEKEDAEAVKRRPTILVILGNPPYNGYAGMANMEEERDLTTVYGAAVAGLPAPQGQGLNDLYIRFFRIAERRIAQNVDGRGIVSFISNNAWLDGLSHTTMRHQYLRTFQQLFIDNLNGDRYRTGKTTPEGRPDPSAFTTPQNREGIQVGTAIATLVRTSTIAPAAGIQLRDLWGTTKLAQLDGESRHEAEPTYDALLPVGALGLPFAHRVHSPAYTTWPRLPELFPVSFPGVKTSRDSLVVDIDRDRLEVTMQKYIGTDVTDAEIAQLFPIAMKRSNRFNPISTRRALQQKGFRPWQIMRYTYRPFDLRWLYWTPETKLLDEKRGEFVCQVTHTRLWLEIRQREASDTFCRGSVSQSLCDQFGNGMSHFVPNAIGREGGLYDGAASEQLNLSDEISVFLSEQMMDRTDFFYYALATMHTPQYRTENAGALLGDWPRIPLPASAQLLGHSAALGRRLAELLDAESSQQFLTEWSFLSRLVLPPSRNLAEVLKITAGWGGHGQGSTVMPGRGTFTAREWTESELARIEILAASQSLTTDAVFILIGDSAIDVNLNGDESSLITPFIILFESPFKSGRKSKMRRRPQRLFSKCDNSIPT